MILVTVCNSCLQPFELQVSPDETHLLKELLDDSDTIACPRLCGGRVVLTPSKELTDLLADSRLRDPVRMTGKELYKAVNGGGMPDEVPASREAVEALLLAHPVIGVGMDVDGKHISINELRLSNRTIIHLTSGRLGAEVLKITRF